MRRIGRRRARAGLRDVTVLELLGSDEIAQETPVQRYRRLQAELAQLADDLGAEPAVRRAAACACTVSAELRA